jgi:hypothetical protein
LFDWNLTSVRVAGEGLNEEKMGPNSASTADPSTKKSLGLVLRKMRGYSFA